MGIARVQTRSDDLAKAEAADRRWWRDAQQDFGCWIWAGSSSGGYGTIWNGERNVMAHVYGWEMTRGPLPEGMELDHVCRVPLCVKFTHFEVVTRATNISRRPPANECRQGHPLVPGNVYRYPKSGARLCIACHPERRPNWFP
jgi:hypothetical protein